MAADTAKTLRNQVMYQVFVRNFTDEGTFAALKEHLADIQELGTDIIWLMPIHPVGKSKRKGTLGSPYAISDYRAVNPEFGTLSDFKDLVDAIHKRGMKCIIDVVYNHTSPDSVLAAEHPEWFYKAEDGSFANRVGDWSDIIDLDYSNTELWDHQIDTLKYWAGIVDGFRCDVAPLIPLEFWKRARSEVGEVHPGCIWLSESVQPGFITYMRDRGYSALSDSEIFQAFDISYDYDCYDDFLEYITGRGTLDGYIEKINRQEYIYPDNYVKLRFLENHDQSRAHFLIHDEAALRNWTAFNYFQKGLTLIYNGQEYARAHLPGLFDKDTVIWSPEDGIDLRDLMGKLAEIKKNPLFADSTYTVNAENGAMIAEHSLGARPVTDKDGIWKRALGIFSADGKSVCVNVPCEDGIYRNLIDGRDVEIFHGMMRTEKEPVIIAFE